MNGGVVLLQVPAAGWVVVGNERQKVVFKHTNVLRTVHISFHKHKNSDAISETVANLSMSRFTILESAFKHLPFPTSYFLVCFPWFSSHSIACALSRPWTYYHSVILTPPQHEALDRLEIQCIFLCLLREVSLTLPCQI